MIFPTNRLLLAVALIVLPFAVIGVTIPGAGGVAIVAVALIVVVGLLDIALAMGRMESFETECSEITRMTKDRESGFLLRLKNSSKKAIALKIGLAFPKEIPADEDVLTANLPQNKEFVNLTWNCLPWKRGQYFFEKCYLEGSSIFGFWAIRRTLPLKAEIRVYPNLMGERKNLAGLFLNRGGIGLHTQRMVGKGRDFEQIREYMPGDSYEDIHWKGTAKRGHPLTKVYQIERTQEVYVVIDASRLSARNAEQVANKSDSQKNEVIYTSMLERFVTSALIMAQVAERQGDNFGLLTFSDKVHKFVPARKSQGHFSSCRDALYTLQPQIVTPDYDEVFTTIRLRQRRRALIVFLTNLDDPALAESFEKHIHIVSKQHLTLVNMLAPVGAQPLFSDYKAGQQQKEVETTTDIYRRLAGTCNGMICRRWNES